MACPSLVIGTITQDYADLKRFKKTYGRLTVHIITLIDFRFLQPMFVPKLTFIDFPLFPNFIIYYISHIIYYVYFHCIAVKLKRNALKY